jgi:hypothetical protein
MRSLQLSFLAPVVTRHRSLHGKPLRKSRTESAAISQELGGSTRMAADLHPA